MVTGEDRGVAPVIGFILIFSFLVIAFSIYQGVVIPEQNKRAEFQHNERTQGQLLNLQDAIRRTGTTGVSQSVSIQVGADYPDRTLGVNFAVTGGRVETVRPNRDGANNITFENVRAVRTEVRDYWDSSASTLEFPTKDIVYTPTYTRYNNAPETVLSNTGVFNRFDGANLSIADQILIQGNRITVVAINGSLDQSRTGEGASVSVDTEALSVATSSVTVENNDTSRRINLTVPTTVANEDVWNASSLEDQDSVYDTTVRGTNLTITLEKGTYSLRMAKVGVGSGTEEEGAEYIVPVEPPPRTVFNDTSHEVTVEVRDRFNNPNSSTVVDATVIGSGTIEPDNGDNETDSQGQVTFNYTAPSNGGSATLVFNISDAEARNADARKVVNHSVQVVENNGGSGVGSGNSDSQFITVLRGPGGVLKSGSTNVFTLKIRNESNLPAKNVFVNASAANTTGSTLNGTFRSSRGDPTYLSNFTRKTTDNRGEVQFNYTAPSTLSAELEMRFAIDTGTTKDNITLSVNVTSTGSGGSDGGTGGVNPGEDQKVILKNASQGATTDQASLYFNNTGSSSVDIVSVRVPFYYPDSQDAATEIQSFGGASSFEGSNTLNIGAPLTTLDTKETLSTGLNNIVIDFGPDTGGTNIQTRGDFFILVMQLSNGEIVTYFVAP